MKFLAASIRFFLLISLFNFQLGAFHGGMKGSHRGAFYVSAYVNKHGVTGYGRRGD